MALTVTVLTHAEDDSQNPVVNTASITPGTSTLVTFILVSNFVGPSGCTLTDAAGLSWVNMFSETDIGNTRRVNIWRAMAASPFSAVIPINNPNMCLLMWAVLEVSGGVDTTGTNGSGAIRQTNAAFGAAPLDAGMAASLATSALIGIWPTRDNSDAATVGSGYTQLTNTAELGNVGKLATEWKTGATDGACGWGTFVQNTVIYGLEVQAGAGPPPDAPSVSAWGMQPPQINRERPSMIASGSGPGTRIV